MPARLIQPYMSHECRIPVVEQDRVPCGVPVYFIRYRYPHHAATSGYDRLCDYIGETIRLSRALYWLGETVLRLPAKLIADCGGQFRYSRYDFVMELEVIRHFLRHHNSVYHFVYAEKSYRFLSRFSGRNGNKVVGTMHHAPEQSAELFRSTEHLCKLDFVTVVSRVQIPQWEAMLGKGKVAYVPYAVDTSYFVPSRAGGPARPPICLFIGHHERDFESLPRLVSLILDGHPKAEFLMLSRDPRCGAIAEQHERAIWCRRASDDEYLRALQQSSLLVLPLKRSTTNTAVLEALACGVPVITNEGGIEDYLIPGCSVVFPVSDVEGMARAACRLLGTPEEWRRMSEAARKRACEFSWTSIARRMVEIYSSLLGEESPLR